MIHARSMWVGLWLGSQTHRKAFWGSGKVELLSAFWWDPGLHTRGCWENWHRQERDSSVRFPKWECINPREGSNRQEAQRRPIIFLLRPKWDDTWQCSAETCKLIQMLFCCTYNKSQALPPLCNEVLVQMLPWVPHTTRSQKEWCASCLRSSFRKQQRKC